MNNCTTATLGVALIGSGSMGAFHGASLAQRLPAARLTAVADPAPGAAERLAADLGASAAYTEPAQALADPDVDAVVIAAPARFHGDPVVAAARAGKALVCEKPAGLSLAELDRGVQPAVRAGLGRSSGAAGRRDPRDPATAPLGDARPR